MTGLGSRQQFSEIGAWNEFHDKKQMSIGAGAGIVNPHNVRVFHECQSPRLPAETLGKSGLGRELGRKQFDGHLPLQFTITPFIHGSHSPPAQHSEDFIPWKHFRYLSNAQRHPNGNDGWIIWSLQNIMQQAPRGIRL